MLDTIQRSPHAFPPTARYLLVAATMIAMSTASSAESTRVIPRETVLARNADAASRFIDVDGVQVRYKDEGTGPVVLLVHGTFGDLADWDDWTAALKGSYRVVRLDLPGFGQSGPIASGNYSVDRQLSLIDGFMDRLDAPRFAIVGVSYGGLVAFRYAATRTDRITALLLMNSAGIEAGSSQDTGPRPPPDLLTRDRIERADVEAMLVYIVGDPKRVTPAMIDRKYDYNNEVGRQEESTIGRKIYERVDPARVLSHVRAPVLVMWGGRNRVLTTDTASAFTTLLKNACSTQQIVYPQGSHMLNLQIPDETVADAKRFFDTELRGTPHCASTTAANR